MKNYFAYTLDFPGGTKEQYDKVLEKMNLVGKTAQGGIFHLASVTPEGVRVFDVWESKEAFDKFLQEKLLPITQELGIKAGQPHVWEVYNILEH